MLGGAVLGLLLVAGAAFVLGVLPIPRAAAEMMKPGSSEDEVPDYTLGRLLGAVVGFVAGLLVFVYIDPPRWWWREAPSDYGPFDGLANGLMNLALFVVIAFVGAIVGAVLGALAARNNSQ